MSKIFAAELSNRGNCIKTAEYYTLTTVRVIVETGTKEKHILHSSNNVHTSLVRTNICVSCIQAQSENTYMSLRSKNSKKEKRN